jgi:hypothetical protein
MRTREERSGESLEIAGKALRCTRWGGKEGPVDGSLRRTFLDHREVRGQHQRPLTSRLSTSAMPIVIASLEAYPICHDGTY